MSKSRSWGTATGKLSHSLASTPCRPNRHHDDPPPSAPAAQVCGGIGLAIDVRNMLAKLPRFEHSHRTVRSESNAASLLRRGKAAAMRRRPREGASEDGRKRRFGLGRPVVYLGF